MNIVVMSKLLFFASDYKIGLSALLCDQLIALYKCGVELCAVAGDHDQEDGLTEKLAEFGIPVIRVHNLDVHSNFIMLAKKLNQIIEENHINVVHVQNNWQLALISYVKYVALRRKKLKIIYTIHAFRNNSSWKSRIAQIVIGTALLLFADRVICMCTYLKKKFRLLSYKIVLLPHGISDMFFYEKNLVLPDRGLQMIFPAQFRKGKNQDMIVKAFANHIIRTGDVESKLILPGNGPLLDDVKKLVAKLRLQNRVLFPGRCPKDETYKMYMNCNIGVIASSSETFGQSIVEPFVLGRCVISTPVGVAIDVIKNGYNGFIFTTEQELSNIFTQLYNDQILIKKIGTNNFKQRDMFRWDKIGLSYKRVLLNE